MCLTLGVVMSKKMLVSMILMERKQKEFSFVHYLCCCVCLTLGGVASKKISREHYFHRAEAKIVLICPLYLYC